MENRKNDPHAPHRALALIQAQPALLARHGALIADWHGCGDRRRGPYYRLRYRQDRRARSIYLGRDGPLVQAVREALAQVQGPLQRWREYQRWRRAFVASLRAHKTILNRRLGTLGLRLHGKEVRGWRMRRRMVGQTRGMDPDQVARLQKEIGSTVGQPPGTMRSHPDQEVGRLECSR